MEVRQLEVGKLCRQRKQDTRFIELPLSAGGA